MRLAGSWPQQERGTGSSRVSPCCLPGPTSGCVPVRLSAHEAGKVETFRTHSTGGETEAWGGDCPTQHATALKSPLVEEKA